MDFPKLQNRISIEAVFATHPWMQEWYAEAADEEWVIKKFEDAAG